MPARKLLTFTAVSRDVLAVESRGATTGLLVFHNPAIGAAFMICVRMSSEAENNSALPKPRYKMFGVNHINAESWCDRKKWEQREKRRGKVRYPTGNKD